MLLDWQSERLILSDVFKSVGGLVPIVATKSALYVPAVIVGSTVYHETVESVRSTPHSGQVVPLEN